MSSLLYTSRFLASSPSWKRRPLASACSIVCLSKQQSKRHRGGHETRRTLLTRAYNVGPSEPPLLEMTVGDHFNTIVQQFGDRPAVITRDQNVTYTYDKLDQTSNSLARGLEKLGIKKGDRVGVSLGNNIEYASVTYALFKLGAILVPLNPAFSATQVISALNHLAATHLIIGLETNLPWKDPKSNIPMLKEIVADLAGSKVESQQVPSLRDVITVDNAQGRIDGSQFRALTKYLDVLDDGGSGKSPLEPRDLSPNEIVNIQFTSGTTSMPKAACLSHRSILNNGKSIGDRMLLTEKDVVCCPPPLFHCFGSILGYMATATHGSAILFPTEAFNPEASLRAVQEYKGTALYGVPTMFLAELELLSSGKVAHEGFEHLRTGIAAGTSVPTALMKKLHSKLNLADLTICYGMTETSPVSCMTTTDDPLDKRVNTVGRLLPHVTAKVVNPADRSEILPIGERGELAVSGYLVMKEYWNDRAKTDEAMVADEKGIVFMHTGDEAVMDSEGYVTITGRIKDIIIRGGENIHPLDIENCLLEHDGIADASGVGIPDEKYGEIVGVFIIKRENAAGNNLSAAEVQQYVRDRLSGHFVPKHVFWIDTFPKTASGKIQRFLLRDEAKRRLAAGQSS